MTSSRENFGGLEKRAHFATTRWSIIVAAGNENTPQARLALATLCETYWYPLYSFVRRQGRDPQTAADLTQGFFVRLLERDDLQTVEQENGRFRAYLLAAMKNYIVNQWHHDRAQKRGGDRRVSLDFEMAEGRFAAEATGQNSPEEVYEKQWGRMLLERARQALRDRYTQNGKSELFERLEGFLAGDATDSHEQAALDLGQTPNSIKVAVHRLRQRYREFLRSEISQTLSVHEDVDVEIRYLFEVLRR